MAIQINAYLNFKGNCRDAMTFYQECLGGELTLQTVAETPMAAQCPTGMQDQIMHSMLISGGMVLMASDMIGPDGFIPGNDITLSIGGGSETETEALFNKLAAGGQIAEPFRKMPWGAKFGAIADKFGKRWMFNSEINGK